MTDAPVTTLLIARHGNTFAPGETPRRVGRRTDLPLVESGHEQARRLGHYLKAQNLSPAQVYCSRLHRTRQTAAGILEALGLSAVIEPQAFSLFDEIDYGPDENKTEEEVIARIGGDAIRAWNETAVPPPGWDVDPGFLKQQWRTFGAEIAASFPGRTILVVTSNGVARFAPALTGDMETFSRTHSLKIATSALCRLTCEAGTWAIRDWNLKPPE